MILLHARDGEPTSKWCCVCFILISDWTKSVVLHGDNVCPDCLETFSNIWTHFLFSRLELFIYYVNNSCLHSQFVCAWSSLPVLLKVRSWGSSVSATWDHLRNGNCPSLPQTCSSSTCRLQVGCVFSCSLGNSAQWLTIWAVLFQGHKCHCYLALCGNSACFWLAHILRCWSPCTLAIKYLNLLYMFMTHTCLVIWVVCL